MENVKISLNEYAVDIPRMIRDYEGLSTYRDRVVRRLTILLEMEGIEAKNEDGDWVISTAQLDALPRWFIDRHMIIELHDVELLDGTETEIYDFGGDWMQAWHGDKLVASGETLEHLIRQSDIWFRQ